MMAIVTVQFHDPALHPEVNLTCSHAFMVEYYAKKDCGVSRVRNIVQGGHVLITGRDPQGGFMVHGVATFAHTGTLPAAQNQGAYGLWSSQSRDPHRGKR